jgi:hypothetical protein
MARVFIWRLAFFILMFAPAWHAVRAHALDGALVATQSQEQNQNEFLSYPLRSGESLGDVARIFRIPVEELLQINRVGDPSRLPIGYTLKIPNVFSRQTTQLRQERDYLAAEQARARTEAREGQQVIAALRGEVQRLTAENDSHTAQLAATAWWRRTAALLVGLLAFSVWWSWLLQKSRKALTKNMASLTRENTALNVAKERYRQAAAQMELRYQKLYRGGESTPAKFIQDGVVFIERTFNEGSARMEQILAAILREQKSAEVAAQADRQEESLFRTLRNFLQRYRLKYREA